MKKTKDRGKKVEYKIKIENIKNEDILKLQEKKEKIEKLEKGQIVEGVVTGIKPYGAFIKMENGLPALVHIEDMSVARIKSPEERLKIGQKASFVVKSIDREAAKVLLSYKETFGSWEENAKKFEEGSKVVGIARETEKEKNGIFVELTPNLVGLAEYKEGIEYGQNVNVYIKKIIPEKKKVKLIII